MDYYNNYYQNIFPLFPNYYFYGINLNILDMKHILHLTTSFVLILLNIHLVSHLQSHFVTTVYKGLPFLFYFQMQMILFFQSVPLFLHNQIMKYDFLFFQQETHSYNMVFFHNIFYIVPYIFHIVPFFHRSYTFQLDITVFRIIYLFVNFFSLTVPLFFLNIQHFHPLKQPNIFLKF